VTADLDSKTFLSPDEELALELDESTSSASTSSSAYEAYLAGVESAAGGRSERARGGSAGAGEPPVKSRRHVSRLESIGVILALVILGVLLTVITWQARRTREEPAQPETLRTTPTTGTAASPNARPGVISTSGAPIPVPPEEMVYVPASTFMMGRNNGDEYERPQQSVSVPAFFIDRTEVTNEQYQKFVDEAHHTAPTNWKNGKFLPGDGKLPVVNVSWNDAVDYARWAKKRLPTEAEWELAARGTDGRVYPWGNQWNATKANTQDAGRGGITEVGSYPLGLSPFGAVDMIGNVWEWTSSGLSSYEDRHVIVPGKVIRGGAFDVPTSNATATYRGVVNPNKGYEKTGFRCVRPIP